MALHHRREMPDMRSAYRDNAMGLRGFTSNSDSSSDRSSDSSDHQSYRTQSTLYSSGPPPRPSRVRWSRDVQEQEELPQYFADKPMQESPPASPASSVETYASTIDSDPDQPVEEPEYDVPGYTARPSDLSAIAATPSEFSDLFPSSRRLDIRHDDSTIDGNMNLRVDTDVAVYGREVTMTLFHLRLQDLKQREFSLRRYCRNSGRGVCHTTTRSQVPAIERRPGLQRSLSNALQSMRPRVEQRSSATPTIASLKRNDSGYGSIHSVDSDREYRPASSGDGPAVETTRAPNSIKLEFSNYAKVEVKRAGTKGSKRYDFEYWGVNYTWQRVVRKDYGEERIALHLKKAGSDRTLAFIEPVALPPQQAQQERDSGGWIPPCTMRIVDNAISGAGLSVKEIDRVKHVADTVVATGLIALVDESIRRHFDSEHTRHVLIPIPRLSVGVEYIGPKRYFSEMFGRKDAGSRPQSRPSSSGGPTPQGGPQRMSLSRRQSSR